MEETHEGEACLIKRKDHQLRTCIFLPKKLRTCIKEEVNESCKPHQNKQNQREEKLWTQVGGFIF